MFDQLNELVQQFGNDAVVKNNAIPNELNEGVMKETSDSILSGLQKMASEGNLDQLAGLFQGNNAGSTSNPVVKQLVDQVSGNLGQKFGIDSNAANGVASSMIPKVLESLVSKAKDPNVKGFEVSDLVNAISGRTAMLKKEYEVEKKEFFMEDLMLTFGRTFFQEQLKIPEENIDGFLFYLAEDMEFRNFYKLHTKLMVEFELNKLAKQYLEKIKG